MIRQGHMKRLHQLACLALFLGVVDQTAAAEKDLATKGEAIVRANCRAARHPGKEGDNPHPPAPSFRTLSSKYPVEDLAESLAEGIVSGHPTCRSSCSVLKTLRRSSTILSRSRSSLRAPKSD